MKTALIKEINQLNDTYKEVQILSGWIQTIGINPIEFQSLNIESSNSHLSKNRKKTQKQIEKKRKGYKKDIQSDYFPDQKQISKYDFSYDSIIKQTKNIPKLYGKGFILFFQKNQQKVLKLLSFYGIDKSEFDKKVQQWKEKLMTIKGIRQIWQQDLNPYAKLFRILCNLFLRKYALSHIFNSKIYLHKRALKYKYKFQQGVRRPQQFTSMKQF